MRKLRAGIAVLFAVILLLAGCSQEDSIQFTAQVNTQITSLNEQSLWELSKLSVAITDDQSKADITLTVDGRQVECQCDCVLFDYEKSGTYGILDGQISIDGRTLPITVDMYYISGKENFSAVTIGAIGDTNFGSWFFGKQTEAINALSEKYMDGKN